MKHIREYRQHTNYQEIHLINSESGFPYLENMKQFRNSDIEMLSKILTGFGQTFFKYRSHPEIDDFAIWRWPLWIHEESKSKWIEYWQDLILERSKKESSINKILMFECKTWDDFFNRKLNSRFNTEILRDDDGYFWVRIDLEGWTKWFRCDQEHGLSECLREEIGNWNFK